MKIAENKTKHGAKNNQNGLSDPNNNKKHSNHLRELGECSKNVLKHQ